MCFGVSVDIHGSYPYVIVSALHPVAVEYVEYRAVLPFHCNCVVFSYSDR